jgi:hypothetical protein
MIWYIFDRTPVPGLHACAGLVEGGQNYLFLKGPVSKPGKFLSYFSIFHQAAAPGKNKKK